MQPRRMNFMAMRFVYVGLLITIQLMVMSCAPPSPQPEPTPPNEPIIYTSFEPLTYLTRRLIGSEILVVCPVPADADPATWQPDDDTIVAMQGATRVIVNGANFESWVAAVSLPTSRLVDTTRDLADQFQYYDSMTHSHGPDGAHTHDGVDGHTWMDPHLAQAQANVIAETVGSAFPESQELIASNRQGLTADLTLLADRWATVSARLDDVILIASHPAYNYLAARYGWKIVNLDIDPQDALDDPALQSVRQAVDRHPDARIRLMLWESEPLPSVRQQLLGELVVHSVVLSPCETPDATKGDWLACMNAGVDRLESAINAR